jgi:hypothetical protein
MATLAHTLARLHARQEAFIDVNQFQPTNQSMAAIVRSRALIDLLTSDRILPRDIALSIPVHASDLPHQLRFLQH